MMTSLYNKNSFSALILFILIFCWPTLGNTKEEEKKTVRSSDKLDIRNLEKKYWSPKDSDYQVVQNRRFSKEGRFAASLMGGLLVNDAYTDSNLLGVNFNYYFTENFGLEFSHINAQSRNSSATNAFIKDKGTAPDHNKIDKASGLSLIYVPFYAKLSFMGTKILYFDMSFGLGMGMSHFNQENQEDEKRLESTPHINFDISQHYFIHEKFAIRVDLKNQWSKQEKIYFVEGTPPRVGDDRIIGTSTFHDTLFLIGITYYH